MSGTGLLSLHSPTYIMSLTEVLLLYLPVKKHSYLLIICLNEIKQTQYDNKAIHMENDTEITLKTTMI